MKRLKKLFSYLIALTMVFSIATIAGVNVHADNGHTLTINNARNGHIYDAYQIFKGDYSDGILTNITEGSGVNLSGLIAALKEDTKFNTTENDNNTNIFKDVKTAADVAKVLGDQNYANDSEKVQEFAKVVNEKLTDTKKSSAAAANKTATISGLETGYYFVKDADTSGNLDVYTRFITRVVGGETNVSLKADVPSVEKKVQDQKDDAEENANDGYGNTADHEINESFKFKLTATIPAATDVANYKDAYKLVFNDNMSDGITFENIDSVKLNGKAKTNGTDKEVAVNPGTEANQYSTTATKDQAGGSWSLTIPDLRKFTELDYSKNVTVTVIYNAHLNANAKVTKASGSTDNKNSVSLDYSNNPNAEAHGTTSHTPGNTVYVFTYELDNTKVDKENTSTKLGGAEFTLKKGDTTIKFTKNNDGAYVIDPNGTIETLTSSNADGDGKGTFNIIGLDAGEYTLTETKAPAGYNKLTDPITIKVTATHSLTNDEKINHVDLSFEKTGDSTTGSSLTIGNSKGSTLPSTGGMGTTLLYAAGGILVACAVAYVVLNKKHAK